MVEPQRTILAKEFSIVTMQNEGKFQFIQPQRNAYAFGEAEQIVDFALANGLKVHGHTLVYDNSNPDWINHGSFSNEELRQIMIDHIKTVVGHFKGRVQEWDVVNEAMAWNPTDNGDGLSDSIWKRAADGPSYTYIDQAFYAAHEADPDALLYINDYGLEWYGGRFQSMYNYVKGALQRGVPIHGVGFESHDYAVTDRIQGNIGNLLKAFSDLKDLGLHVRVSEMTVTANKSDPDDKRKQAIEFAGEATACV